MAEAAPLVGMRVTGPDGAEIGLVSAVLPDRILVLVVLRDHLMPREEAIALAHVQAVEAGVVRLALSRAAVVAGNSVPPGRPPENG